MEWRKGGRNRQLWTPGLGAKLAPASRAARTRNEIWLQERGYSRRPDRSGAAQLGVPSASHGPAHLTTGSDNLGRFSVGPQPGAAAKPGPTRAPEIGAPVGNAGAETSGPRAQAGAAAPRPGTNFCARRRPCGASEGRRHGAPGSSPPVGQPHSLSLTYPSWPSGWCPAAPTLCPAAASGRSAGRTALPERWAVHRSLGAPQAPVVPCRLLLRD